MKLVKSILVITPLFIILLGLTGCFFGKNNQVTTNYYVLDYLKATENIALVQIKPFDKTLEIMDTKLPRTYDRNQLVKKQSFASISYFDHDLWANRLYDAVPNIISQRLNAYNIFTKCARDLGDATPDYYVETYIQNIEYIDSETPQAFLRMEFYLRKSSDQSVVFSQVDERTQDVRDASVDYLVQTYNQMIMYETDMFAGRCIDFLSGRPVREAYKVASAINKFYDKSISIPIDSVSSGFINTGELFVPMRIASDIPITYIVTRIDTLAGEIEAHTGVMNESLSLKPGKYDLSFGSDLDVSTDVLIEPKMRTVVTPTWGELLVHIIDQSQTRVKMQYDLYYKAPNANSYDEHISSRYSPSDEIGETDYIWIVKPGNYMITLQGDSPASLTNFTTIMIEEGKSYVETIVVNPEGGRNVLIGAGLLESSEALAHIPFHKGAIHADVNLASSNLQDEKHPDNSITLAGQFDNKLEYDKWPFHYISKSLYELGFNKTSDTDLQINVDDYSLKNSLVFYPWKKNKTLKNFGVYGRADISNTHAFADYVYYPAGSNFYRINAAGDTIKTLRADKIKVNQPPFPLSLREDTGLTYRWTVSPSVSMNIRGGYGWNQDFNKGVYNPAKPDTIRDNANRLIHVYQEKTDAIARGFKSSIIFSAYNILNFISINSTFDVLFPYNVSDTSIIYENDNIVNIKLYRNISLDIKANAKYNKENADYIVTDYNAFLRVSLYY